MTTPLERELKLDLEASKAVTVALQRYIAELERQVADLQCELGNYEGGEP